MRWCRCAQKNDARSDGTLYTYVHIDSPTCLTNHTTSASIYATLLLRVCIVTQRFVLYKKLRAYARICFRKQRLYICGRVCTSVIRGPSGVISTAPSMSCEKKQSPVTHSPMYRTNGAVGTGF